MKTDTAAQAALGQHIGEVAAASTASINAAQGEVQALADSSSGLPALPAGQMVRLQEGRRGPMNGSTSSAKRSASPCYTNTDGNWRGHHRRQQPARPSEPAYEKGN